VTNQLVSIASGLRQAVGFNSRRLEGASGAPRLSRPMAGVVFLALLAVGCLPGLASAGMRCGSRIIDKGSSGAEVTSYCGPPSQVDRRDGDAAVQVEFWTYNFGPNLLMERVRIEDGIVADVQSLGYGFDEP
jgi:hypothetical protein